MKTRMTVAVAALCAAAGLTSGAGAMEVTVYNQNLGLVTETRSFALKSGANDIKVNDVAAQIDPTSVHFKSLTAPDAVTVVEQNFEYDLINQDKLLEKYLGKEIELERFLGVGGDRREVVKGTLLSHRGGSKVIQANGKIYLNPPGNPVLPELPEGLISKPTLLWQLAARKGGTHSCEISYLTAGMGWHADYVLSLSPKDDAIDLNAWVTIDNNSGATYKDARLKLVAGDVHRAQPPMAPMAMAGRMASMAESADAAPQFRENAFFEYHMYTLQRPTTLKESETKQIEMASAQEAPVKKLFIYDGASGYGADYNEYTRSDPNYGIAGQKKVWVMLEFKNSKDNKLGMPLPAGRIRVYKKQDDGALGFVGEDNIDHTPKDEKVRVRMGNAFDVVGERKRSNFLSDARKRWFEESFEIKLRNHKSEDITVRVVEHLYRWNQWKLTENSHDFKKKDAQTVEFEVPVKKDGETVVTYTVKYSW
ncbi:MAG: DUF4139 domain-containing protein [Elusimicrobia bacterium]|nr:DUF4139 domain-containing protein [Elusimicrobiota bacterium]